MKFIKTILFLFFSSIVVAQTTRLEYFRTKVVQNEIILYWTTFTEDGPDVFTLVKSQDVIKWELITTVPAKEIKNGATYEVKIDRSEGIWYYKLTWKDGFSYSVTNILTKKNTEHIEYYNILGQKTNQGWLIH